MMKNMFLRSRATWIVLGATCVAMGSGQAAMAAGVTLADSVLDYSNTQGQGNWEYGYYATPGDSSTFTLLPTNLDDPSTSNHGLVWGGQQGNSIYDSPWLSSSEAFPYNDNGSYLWPVRRWTSTYSGIATITGGLQDVNGYGDGTLGLIYINGVNAASASNPIALSTPLAPTSAPSPLGGIPSNVLLSNDLFPGDQPVTYSWQGNINAGDQIDFALSHDIIAPLRGTLLGALLPQLPGFSGLASANNDHDSTIFTARIEGHPASAAAVPTPAMLPGLIGFGLNLLRKRREEKQAA